MRQLLHHVVVLLLLQLLLLCFGKCQPECSADTWRASTDYGKICSRGANTLCDDKEVKLLSNGLLGIRSVQNDLKCNKDCPDDSTLKPDWYKVGGLSDNSIPEHCPKNEAFPNNTLCGQAVFPAYIVNVNPEKRSPDKIWTAETCYTSSDNECCSENSTRSKILLYHCEFDIIYYLVPFNSSDYRYCTVNRPRCAYGYSSPTGFVPCKKAVKSNSTSTESSNKRGWVTVDGSPLFTRKDPPGGVQPVAIVLIVICAMSLFILTLAGIIIITCWNKHEEEELQAQHSASTRFSNSNTTLSTNTNQSARSQPNGARRRNRDFTWADDKPGYINRSSPLAQANQRNSSDLLITDLTSGI